MTTSTSTPTEVTAIAVAATGDGVRVTAGGGALRAITLARGRASARVALVPDRALLLTGDRVRVEVSVGSGVRLELVETAGTVAYDMRGGSARWELAARVADSAAVAWAGLPFVVSRGARVTRTLDVSLAGSASLVLRETLVLGRHREAPGQVVSVTSVSRDGCPVLLENLEGSHLAPFRVLDSVLAFGSVPEADSDTATRLNLESGDVIWRSTSGEAHESARELDAVWRAASAMTGRAAPA